MRGWSAHSRTNRRRLNEILTYFCAPWAGAQKLLRMTLWGCLTYGRAAAAGRSSRLAALARIDGLILVIKNVQVPRHSEQFFRASSAEKCEESQTAVCVCARLCLCPCIRAAKRHFIKERTQRATDFLLRVCAGSMRGAIMPKTIIPE